MVRSMYVVSETTYWQQLAAIGSNWQEGHLWCGDLQIPLVQRWPPPPPPTTTSSQKCHRSTPSTRRRWTAFILHLIDRVTVPPPHGGGQASQCSNTRIAATHTRPWSNIRDQIGRLCARVLGLVVTVCGNPRMTPSRDYDEQRLEILYSLLKPEYLR